MFRRWLNYATIRIAISPRGPILVKSGQASADPTRPGMEFVRSRHAVHGETVYLPGTSLKGALRSQAERVCRGLGIRVCDPFVDSGCRSAGRSRDVSPTGTEVFAKQCAACQTFGSLSVAGRCSLEDAYPWDGKPGEATVAANATETRWQVGIDRRTGQAQTSALFDLEVVVAGTFYTTIHLENFALWQLGLIGALLVDVDQGDVPIGSGKSRGLGQVGVQVNRVEIETLGCNAGRLLGAGALCPPDEARQYNLATNDVMNLSEITPSPTWRGSRITVEGDAAQGFLAAAMDGPLKSWIATSGLPESRR